MNETVKPRILVVDDEREIVETLKHFLSAKGYEVMGALNGEDALSILEKEKADVILLDIMMPGLKGDKVARIIKARHPQTKIIILTAYPEDGESLASDNLLEALFTKPIRIQELYNKLWELFSQEEPELEKPKSPQGVKARVLLLKAKLLFLEPKDETNDFLKKHFKGLTQKGENYEIERVANYEDFEEKISVFEPDILLVNSSLLSRSDKDAFLEFCKGKICFKEILVYTAEQAGLPAGQAGTQLSAAELARLIKAVEITCLKHGLLEIKWVEI